jgi:pSer/pThr/pTyr-binding forkhead associated (FHA) protein
MPSLTLLLGRKPIRVYKVNGALARIGREPDLEIVIDNTSISRRQAKLSLKKDGTWIVRDLDSANGTFLNGHRLLHPVMLRPGDEISFGKFAMLFERQLDAARVPQPAPMPAVDGRETVHMSPAEVERLQTAVTRERQAQLTWCHGDRRGTHVLEREAVVGRAEGCDVRLSWPAPKKAAIISRNGYGYEVRAFSRWYPLRINGARVRQARLKSGDRVLLGRLEIVFLDKVD